MMFKKGSKNRAGVPPKRSDGSGIEASKIEYYAARESGKGNIEFLHLSDISMDETNPRTKGVDASILLKVIREFLIIDPAHKEYNQTLVEDRKSVV